MSERKRSLGPGKIRVKLSRRPSGKKGRKPTRSSTEAPAPVSTPTGAARRLHQASLGLQLSEETATGPPRRPSRSRTVSADSAGEETDDSTGTASTASGRNEDASNGDSSKPCGFLTFTDADDLALLNEHARKMNERINQEQKRRASTVPSLQSSLSPVSPFFGADLDEPAHGREFSLHSELLAICASPPKRDIFLRMLDKKYATEPFLCWEAVTKLVRSVRMSAFANPRQQADAVCDLVNKFVADDGEFVISVSRELREELLRLGRDVRLGPSTRLNVRPLLALQKEAEPLLIADVRAFCMEHPASDDPSTHADEAGVLPMSLHEGLMRVKKVPRGSIERGKKVVTSTRDQRFCCLDAYYLMVFKSRKLQPTEKDMPKRILPLHNSTVMEVNKERGVYAFSLDCPESPKYTFYFGSTDRRTCQEWMSRIQGSIDRQEGIRKEKAEAHERILSSPLVPIPIEVVTTGRPDSDDEDGLLESIRTQHAGVTPQLPRRREGDDDASPRAAKGASPSSTGALADRGYGVNTSMSTLCDSVSHDRLPYVMHVPGARVQPEPYPTMVPGGKVAQSYAAAIASFKRRIGVATPEAGERSDAGEEEDEEEATTDDSYGAESPRGGYGVAATSALLRGNGGGGAEVRIPGAPSQAEATPPASPYESSSEGDDSNADPPYGVADGTASGDSGGGGYGFAGSALLRGNPKKPPSPLLSTTTLHSPLNFSIRGNDASTGTDPPPLLGDSTGWSGGGSGDSGDGHAPLMGGYGGDAGSFLQPLRQRQRDNASPQSLPEVAEVSDEEETVSDGSSDTSEDKDGARGTRRRGGCGGAGNDDDGDDLDIFDFNRQFQSCLDRLRGFSTGVHRQDEAELLAINVGLIRLSEDFINNAKRYGRIIISEVALPTRRKTIQPIDVGGVIGGEKYIVHNILFKFAVDREGMFGFDHALAAKVAGHELKGLKACFSANISGLYFPLMALIDYKGFRIIATSLLPLSYGSLVHGSNDAGITIHRSNRRLNAKIRTIGRLLNLKPHRCGAKGVVMAGPVDLEGHLGDDGRFYLLDFSRMFPPVTPNPSKQAGHLYEMFRPEFVMRFGLFPLCSDAYSGFVAMHKEAVDHADEINTATTDLLGDTVTHFSQELIELMDLELNFQGTLMDFSITQAMHRHGINMRYMGHVIRKMGPHPYRHILLLHCLARIIKLEIRSTLRGKVLAIKAPVDEPFRLAVTDCLNHVFSNYAGSTDYWETTLRSRLNEKFELRPSNWRLFPTNLKKDLFRTFVFGQSQFDGRFYLFCQVERMTGLVFTQSLVGLLRSYPPTFEQPTIFDDTDIIDLGDRVKHLDVISNAKGYVFTARGAQKEKTGMYPAAIQLYARALAAFEDALVSTPLDVHLLRNCARTLLRIDHLYQIMGEEQQRMLVKEESIANTPNTGWRDMARSTGSTPSVASRMAESFKHEGMGSPITPRSRHLLRRGSSATRSNSGTRSDLSTSANGTSPEKKDETVRELRPITRLVNQADTYMLKAIQAAPGNAVSHHLYAQLQESIGVYDRAESHYLLALQKDPWFVSCLADYAMFLLCVRDDPDLAERFHRRADLVAEARTAEPPEAREGPSSSGSWTLPATASLFPDIESASSLHNRTVFKTALKSKRLFNSSEGSSLMGIMKAGDLTPMTALEDEISGTHVTVDEDDDHTSDTAVGSSTSATDEAEGTPPQVAEDAEEPSLSALSILYETVKRSTMYHQSRQRLVMSAMANDPDANRDPMFGKPQ